MYIPQKGVGEVIKELRKQLNMIQEELAEKVGKQGSSIGRIETQDGENIKVSTLLDILENGLNGKIELQ